MWYHQQSLLLSHLCLPSAIDREAADTSPIVRQTSHPCSFDSYDQQSFHPSVTGSSPPYQHPFHPSPPYQQPFHASPTFEDPQYSSSYPPSSPCSSLLFVLSSCSSPDFPSTMSSISSPPPPPLKMRPWKFFTNGATYAWRAMSVSALTARLAST
ncbi:unnamed protein product [Cochlearia groenlandica]